MAALLHVTNVSTDMLVHCCPSACSGVQVRRRSGDCWCDEVECFEFGWPERYVSGLHSEFAGWSGSTSVLDLDLPVVGYDA